MTIHINDTPDGPEMIIDWPDGIVKDTIQEYGGLEEMLTGLPNNAEKFSEVKSKAVPSHMLALIVVAEIWKYKGATLSTAEGV